MTIWTALLVLVLGLVALHRADASPPAGLEERLAGLTDDTEFATEYIRGFHESVCRKQPRPARCLVSIRETRRWRRAPEVAEAIVSAGLEFGVPVEELLVLARYESSFRPSVIGGVGEIGLYQVHGRAARGDADLSTLRGQARAGARWYAYCRDRCRCRIEALGAYQSGRCTVVAGARLRERAITALECVRQ